MRGWRPLPGRARPRGRRPPLRRPRAGDRRPRRDRAAARRSAAAGGAGGAADPRQPAGEHRRAGHRALGRPGGRPARGDAEVAPVAAAAGVGAGAAGGASRSRPWCTTPPATGCSPPPTRSTRCGSPSWPPRRSTCSPATRPGGPCSGARTGLALWRGRPFTPLAPTRNGPRPRWAGWRRPAGNCVECRIECLLAVGAPRASAARGGGRLAEHPLRERLWAQRMIAAYRSGRTSDALAAYRIGAELMLDELGIEPGAELRELQSPDSRRRTPPLRRVRPRPGQAASAAPTTPAPAPAAGPGGARCTCRRGGRALVGRDHGAGRADRAAARTPLVTIVGPPGVGKTRLVVEAAQRAAAAS